MKYIKLFEQQWQQPDQGEELLDFSIDNLAYLMDDGYKVIVETSSDVYDAIRIRKGDGDPFVPPYNRQAFNWNEVKDIILPYLIRVNRKYDLEVVTFYTERLSGSTSFTKEGAAKIKDLLEEKTIPLYYDWNSNVNPRSQVFEEIRIKVKKLPLIYNRNESFDRWSRDQKNELTEYCETNLAYLMDEGFKIRVGQNIDKTMSTFGNISIQIKYVGTAGDTEEFFYTDIKDHFIPFILRLEKEYDIKKIRFLGQDNFHYIKDNFEEELDTLPFYKVSYIDIFLSGEKEQINESLSQKEEIEDFCDTHLAYLTDDNFSINYAEHYGGNVTELTIKTLSVTQLFTWEQVKDHFIPFLHMLSKEYKLFNFHFEDFDCKKNEFVCFKTFMGSKHYYSYDDVISDNIDTKEFTDRYGLYSIKLKIGKRII